MKLYVNNDPQLENAVKENGRGGGGRVVSVLAFYSDDHSSNPADTFSCSVFEKNKNKQKEAGIGPFKKLRKENV